MDLNKISLFVRVVEAQGFTAAASALGIPKSSVSRGVAQLEEELGTRLLHRTTRKSSLTDAGRAYYDLASRALAGLEDARVAVSCKERTASGTVRLTAPPDLAIGVLPDLLVAFSRKEPAIQVELVLTNRVLDLVEEGIDLALRPGKLRDSSLVAKRIGPLHLGLFAAPSYLKKRGEPASVESLKEHDCVVFRPRQDGGTWRLGGPKGEETVVVKGPLSADDFGFVHRAVIAGAGVGLLPLFLAAEDEQKGRLVALLPEHQVRGGIMSLVYPSSRLMPRRVVLLRDFLAEKLTQHAGECEKTLEKARSGRPRRSRAAAE